LEVYTRTCHREVRAGEGRGEVGDTSLATYRKLRRFGVLHALNICRVVVRPKKRSCGLRGQAVTFEPRSVLCAAHGAIQCGGVARAAGREFVAKVLQLLHSRTLVGLRVVYVVLHIIEVGLNLHLSGVRAMVKLRTGVKIEEVEGDSHHHAKRRDVCNGGVCPLGLKLRDVRRALCSIMWECVRVRMRMRM